MTSKSSTTTDTAANFVSAECREKSKPSPDQPDSTNDPTSTMLATAKVRTLASDSKSSQFVRALTDSGSQHNVITHDCVQRLGMRFTQITTHITGIGNTNAMRAVGIIDMHIQHCRVAEPMTPIRLLVVSKISARLPAHRVKNVLKPEINSDQFADPQYWIPAKIDMLVGAGLWARIVSGEMIRKDVVSIIYLAQKTLFGWTILSSPNRIADVAYLG